MRVLTESPSSLARELVVTGSQNVGQSVKDRVAAWQAVADYMHYRVVVSGADMFLGHVLRFEGPDSYLMDDIREFMKNNARVCPQVAEKVAYGWLSSR